MFWWLRSQRLFVRARQRKDSVCYSGVSVVWRSIVRHSLAGYQLSSLGKPLDENLQGMSHTTPTFSSNHPLRVSPDFPQSPSDLEVQQCFYKVDGSQRCPSMKTAKSLELPGNTPEPQKGTAAKKKPTVRKPQPIRLIGVDSVFGTGITVQPPKCTKTFKVSETSAFGKIVSKEKQRPICVKESQIEMALAMCKQVLRFIFLLYVVYKMCIFALQHSQ
ncbi:FANCD2 opposite strand protein-like [Rattus rattus]|uniref:FANCD2 opposite strand protein-like n=1 Tax=Rattus rattus TaxID=10117 RepID=UPI0013F2BD37|nr:FANCD2 opposite strand protein-like [Rattus rattus]